jgi:uncharacterized protein (TIGR02466 family)
MSTDYQLHDQIPEIEALDLWASHLFVTSYPYHTLQKEALLTLIRQDAAQQQVIQSEVAVTAKSQLAESELDFLDRDDDDLQMLNAYLSELVTTVAGDVNAAYWPDGAGVQSILVESWYHLTQNGGYHDVHSHPNCSWCGIYYVDIGEANFAQRNGLNRFYDPRVNADHHLDAGAAYLNQTGLWDIEPVEGQIVLFPSYLKHSALPYFGKKDRVVIAFNARVDFVE